MDLFEDDSTTDNTPEFTVAEITGAVKRTIEGAFTHIRVRGEVGRVSRAPSGHVYFDIKEDRNVLACVSWKGQVSRLTAFPEEGMEVVATGKITTFGSQSKYQMNVEDVVPAGEGALMAMLEKRKKQLAAEGLFDEARKKPLPLLPEIIGVVTSPTGAVIRDILHRLRERFPRKVLVWPVAVQGKACAPQVAAAIEGFNRLTPGGALPRPDLLIVARGGGSIEDLWGFNEEAVARAAAASDIPLISAVGHETDTTLIDFVSDKRAPTPTAAAELAVPVRMELMAWSDATGARMSRALGQAVERRSERLRDLARALPRPEALLSTPRQRLDLASTRLPGLLRESTGAKRQRLSQAAGALRPALLQGQLRQSQSALAQSATRLTPALQARLAAQQARLDKEATRLRPRALGEEIAKGGTRLDTLAQRFAQTAKAQQAEHLQRLDALDRMRLSLGPDETLKRGFAIVRDGDDVVTSAKAAEGKSPLTLQFADGRVTVPAGAAQPKRKAKDTPPDQGSLF